MIQFHKIGPFANNVGFIQINFHCQPEIFWIISIDESNPLIVSTYFMRGRPYYEEEEYQRYLISRDRKEIFPIEKILNPIPWTDCQNCLDFGMGRGYFSPAIIGRLPKDSWLWGAECQEEIIDLVLKRKGQENLNNMTVFYMERTEHPLLPDWIPDPDIIFCSCVMSTFADPSLAIAGIGRKMQNEGQFFILDWERCESPAGPPLQYKISSKRMQYSIEEAGYEIVSEPKINEWLYYFCIKKTQKAIDEKNQFSYLDY